MKIARGLIQFSMMLLIPATAGTLSADPADRVHFARDVLPILSDKCFVCHGPDVHDDDQLRLDSFAAATVDRGGYRALDPDMPESSEILARIHSADDPMPPSDADKKLTDQQREMISRWVLQGGAYEAHWAYVPPRKVLLPAQSANLSKVAILDAFVQDKHRAAGVSFAPEADRATLARRVALVLTGLPPEPEQLAQFVGSTDPDAYERLVDQLLHSPAFGEHQARYWLDAVRYGDTHGLHLDNRRGIYPYRDWVVHALNSGLPLDDFITWQIAGDLLPNPTLAQRVATGFVRMNPTTSEGGAIPAEFQAKNNFDRTETLGTVLLGSTLTCARCHTHKYDPIPQTEYYRLLAFFNSTAENSMDGNAYSYGPVIRAPGDHTAWSNWLRLESARDELLAAAAVALESADSFAEIPDLVEARESWESTDWQISQPVDANDPPPTTNWRTAKGPPGTGSEKLPQRNQGIWVSFRVHVPGDQSLWLTFSSDSGAAVILDGQPVSVGPAGSPLQATAMLELSAGTHCVQVKMVGDGRGTKLEARLSDPWRELFDGRHWKQVDRNDQLRMLADPLGLFAHLKLQKQARELLHQIAQAQRSFTTTLVAQDLETPRETRVLRRGEYDRPIGEPLEPGVLTVMGPFPDDAPRNRLGLARWLTSRKHPLVARVLVNRIWQRTFGEGLVRSPEDFGLQGDYPTHPELLDWLAVELQDSGWNLKHMLRLMVLSRTFRQESARRAQIDDPENRLLARGPRHRLDAEVLRDIALWSSGLLDRSMGGEGVKPYQPDGMWLAMAHPASNTKRYQRDSGARLYRRSLYVYWKRTSPHPMMTLFDAPDRESSCVRRSRTSTSLQSLALLNETQRIEMSRMFAERLLREADGDEPRFRLLFNLLACRPPTEQEQAACVKLLRTMRERYSMAEEDAHALLSVGDAPRDHQLDPAEHAAWTQVAVTVLASDVAIMLY